METQTPSRKAFIAGWIISGLCIAFLLFDAVMKVIKDIRSIEGSVNLGWPEELVQSIGITLLVCTILYTIPKTSVLGAILLTGYLGGAASIMVRAAQPLYFSVAFGILVWAGLYLRTPKLRALLPLVKE